MALQSRRESTAASSSSRRSEDSHGHRDRVLPDHQRHSSSGSTAAVAAQPANQEDIAALVQSNKVLTGKLDQVIVLMQAQQLQAAQQATQQQQQNGGNTEATRRRQEQGQQRRPNPGSIISHEVIRSFATDVSVRFSCLFLLIPPLVVINDDAQYYPDAPQWKVMYKVMYGLGATDLADKREVQRLTRKSLRDFRSRLSSLIHAQAAANYAEVRCIS